jgi:hypothetical protein
MVQIARIAPLRAANIVGALYFVLFGVFALLFVPFVGSLPVDPKVDPQQQESIRATFRWMLIAYPVLGAVSGWIFVLIGAALYNVLAPRIGGLAFETEPSE